MLRETNNPLWQCGTCQREETRNQYALTYISFPRSSGTRSTRVPRRLRSMARRWHLRRMNKSQSSQTQAQGANDMLHEQPRNHSRPEIKSLFPSTSQEEDQCLGFKDRLITFRGLATKHKPAPGKLRARSSKSSVILSPAFPESESLRKWTLTCT